MNTDETESNVTEINAKQKKGQRYWQRELDLSRKRLSQWHRQADRINNRYIDRQKDESGRVNDTSRPDFSLNLFNSNVTTLNSMLYGNLPKVSVDRKFADSQDDPARVAAEMMERLLNADISENGEDYDTVLRSALIDRLVPGLGCARVRYEMTAEATTDPLTGIQTEQVTSESAPVEYYHWRDLLWGWSRNFNDIPWLAYRTNLTKDEMTERFGKEKAGEAQYAKQQLQTEEGENPLTDQDAPNQTAEVWEIWDKQERRVSWFTKGADTLLETKDDPLQLTRFYPSPAFFIANPTTSLYQPTPDFHLSQDLYNEIDILQSRISMLTSAVKAVGVYDASAEGVQRIFTEGSDNTLIPVDNWALFAEKGGLKGQIDWVPIADITAALDKLTQMRDQTIGLLQQVTGMADVMRGNLDSPYEGVGQSQIKAKFGSVRIQALQDDFAKFASELMQIKAEIISRHFDPQRIVQASNMAASLDAELLPQAIQLIKNPEVAKFRVTIRPESVAMTDFAQLQNERVAYMNALSTFLQSAAPLIQEKPEAEPYLLHMLQWGLAGFKGASEIEGVLDKAIEESIKALKAKQDQPEPQDPSIEQEKIKQQGEMQKIQAKTQGDMQLRAQDLQADMQTDMARHQQKMQEIAATMHSTLSTIQAKAAADIEVEVIQSQANLEQSQGETQAELEKDAANVAMELQKSSREHQQNLNEKLVEHRLNAAQAERDSQNRQKEAKSSESGRDDKTSSKPKGD